MAQPSSSSSSRIGGTVIVIKPKGRKEIDKYKFRINSISATFSRFVMDFIVHKNPREIIFPSILTIVLNPIKSLKKKKQQTNQFDFCFSIIKLSVSPRFDSIRGERIEQIWRIQLFELTDWAFTKLTGKRMPRHAAKEVKQKQRKRNYKSSIKKTKTTTALCSAHRIRWWMMAVVQWSWPRGLAPPGITTGHYGRFL